MTGRARALLEQGENAAAVGAHPLPDTPDEWMKTLCNDPEQADFADTCGQLLALTGCALIDVFADLELVRFILELDPLLLSHGAEYRGLYRLAMKGLLPERVRTRQDKGRFEPAIAASALCADALEFLRDLSSLDALATRGLVDPVAFAPLFDVWLSGVRRGEREDWDPADECWLEVWQLLSCEAFLREHGRGRALA